MIVPNSVSFFLAWLKHNYHSGSFDYADAEESFCKVAKKHFQSQSIRLCGVYLVRQKETTQILYIGKGGTLTTSGEFKGQDIPGRLINTRGKIAADKWFGQVAKEHGAIQVEYIGLRPPLSPAYVEAALLQAFMSEYGMLPAKNKCL